MPHSAQHEPRPGNTEHLSFMANLTPGTTFRLSNVMSSEKFTYMLSLSFLKITAYLPGMLSILFNLTASWRLAHAICWPVWVCRGGVDLSHRAGPLPVLFTCRCRAGGTYPLNHRRLVPLECAARRLRIQRP